jgi:hypothetical protein
MKLLIIVIIIIYILVMFGMYLVKDYRDGIIYTGFVGRIQNLIKH